MKAGSGRAAALLALAVWGSAEASGAIPPGPPEALVDLTTRAGTALVSGTWRYSDTMIFEVDSRGPGPDLKPSGPPNRTYDYAPRAGGAGFDDSAWTVLEPESLQARRSTGRLSFNWYRINVTIPERVAGFVTAGSTVVFEVVVDDYSEVWVDGRLPRVLGQSGGGLAGGFNAPNRVVLTHDAQPGRRFQIAVFGINGPISDPPSNFIWVRSATLEFHRKNPPGRGREVPVEIVRLDPEMDRIAPAGTPLYRIAEGFTFIEGPVWHPDGYLLFSSPNSNVIHRWSPGGTLSIYRAASGYTGADIGDYGQPGPNGLALDAEGRLTVCEHGNRRVVRQEKNGVITVLADRFEGRRLNSPNDLVYRSDGTLYFTDPPFGLPNFHDDPRRELDVTGIYLLKGGRLRLVGSELTGPNGLAFSPDEKHLYVDNWDTSRKVVLRYDVAADGALSNGHVFFDMQRAPGEEALDGLKVDREGNLYVSGPGGVWVISAAGRHLGTIVAPELPANFAFGDGDGRALYMTARTGLYRMRLGIPGSIPSASGDAQTRSALQVTRPDRTGGALDTSPAPGGIVREDARLDTLLAPDARLETVVDGFEWLEGPAWDRDGGALIFSDIPGNAVYRWFRGRPAELFLRPSGYSGATPFEGREPGSNGLAIDAAGRLILCEHGDRRVTRLERGGARTVLADRYQGRRLNSPNDVIVLPGGDLIFTDPPYGLPKGFDDPGRELDFCGVYRISSSGVNDRLSLLTKDIKAPNGVALSPDTRTLYVSNSDPGNPVWLAFDIMEDGALSNRRIFADARAWTARGPGNPDGMEVDRDGNLWAAGPGGVYVFASDGSHLGTILTGGAASNATWGEDGSVLYITAGRAIHRLRTKTSGARF